MTLWQLIDLDMSCTNHNVYQHVHHVPKCMSCHKAIVVIYGSGRTYCFHDHIYIYIYIYMYMKPTSAGGYIRDNSCLSWNIR